MRGRLLSRYCARGRCINHRKQKIYMWKDTASTIAKVGCIYPMESVAEGDMIPQRKKVIDV